MMNDERIEATPGASVAQGQSKTQNQYQRELLHYQATVLAVVVVVVDAADAVVIVK
jgi:hypothetical protein